MTFGFKLDVSGGEVIWFWSHESKIKGSNVR